MPSPQHPFRLLVLLFFSGILFGVLILSGNNKAAVTNVLNFQENLIQKTVPRGAQYVSLFKFSVKPETDTTLRKLGFYQTLGNFADIQQGHLAVQGKFLKESPLLEENGFLFWDNLQIPFSKNSELVFEILIDLKKEIPDKTFYRFELRGNETMTIPAPISSNVTVSSFLASNVIIKNPGSALKAPMSIGKDQTIGRFAIKAGNNDIRFKRIKLHQAEQIDPIRLSNIRLVSENVLLSEKQILADQSVDFVLLKEGLIKKKKERRFSIVADINDAWKIEKIRFFLKNPSDLFVQDVEYGEGASIMNLWGIDHAWCLGSSSVQCQKDGFRKRCTKAQIKAKERDC